MRERESGSKGVTAFIEYFGLSDVTSHRNIDTTIRHGERNPSEKHSDGFSVSIKSQVTGDRMCLCVTRTAVTADSPLKTQVLTRVNKLYADSHFLLLT